MTEIKQLPVSLLDYNKGRFKDSQETRVSLGTTNEHLIRRDKEDNNISSTESQNCDVGLGEAQMQLLQELQEQMAELRERLDAQEKKTVEKKPRKKEVNPLISKGRAVFEKRYADLFEGGVYYWQAKDAAAMGDLTKKIIHSRKQRGMGVEEDEVLMGLEAFLNSITDPWLLKNFSVTNINSKYNEIVAQAKAAVASRNINGANQTTKEDRVRDAVSVMARLEAKERGDSDPIRE